MAVAHYLEALKWQKELIKIHTVFGGKNPHPNYLVGGMACAIDLDSDNAINIERLNLVQASDRSRQRSSSSSSTFPICSRSRRFYPEWTKIGGGLGSYMAYGDVPQAGIDDPSQFRFPRGVILDTQPRRGARGRSDRSAGRSASRSRTRGTSIRTARRRCIPGKA